MINKFFDRRKIKYVYVFIFIFVLYLINKSFDIDFISRFFYDNQEDLISISFYSIIILFLLRSISIVIPILPGTYCSVIAGYMYGFKFGLVLIFIADFLACSFSFCISRKFGREFIKKFLGQRQMKKVEIISQKYLENNFFLMTGLLLTSWFDFVCYAVGLTKISWKKFMPALIFSIIVSDAPFVAAGQTLSALKNVSLQKILSGEVNLISGNYLILLIGSSLLIFGLGLLNIFLKKKMKIL